jgi:hypothetical protein
MRLLGLLSFPGNVSDQSYCSSKWVVKIFDRHCDMLVLAKDALKLDLGRYAERPVACDYSHNRKLLDCVVTDITGMQRYAVDVRTHASRIPTVTFGRCRK